MSSSIVWFDWRALRRAPGQRRRARHYADPGVPAIGSHGGAAIIGCCGATPT